jgi:hypothetical protein
MNSKVQSMNSEKYQYTSEMIEHTARELFESGELPGIDLEGATIWARRILLVFYDRVDRWQYLKNLHTRDWDLFFKHTSIGAMRLLEFPEVGLIEEQKGSVMSVQRGLGKSLPTQSAVGTLVFNASQNDLMVMTNQGWKVATGMKDVLKAVGLF